MGKSIIPLFELEELNASKEWDKFTSQLRVQINYMMQRDMEKLLSLVYRMDVSEEKFNLVLKSSSDVAKGLADLIIAREEEKIAYRIRYSSN